MRFCVETSTVSLFSPPLLPQRSTAYRLPSTYWARGRFQWTIQVGSGEYGAHLIRGVGIAGEKLDAIPYDTVLPLSRDILYFYSSLHSCLSAPCVFILISTAHPDAWYYSAGLNSPPGIGMEKKRGGSLLCLCECLSW